MVQTRAWKGWPLAEAPLGSGAPSLLSSLLSVGLHVSCLCSWGCDFIPSHLPFPFLRSPTDRRSCGSNLRSVSRRPSTFHRTAFLGLPEQPPPGPLPPVLLLHHPVRLRAFASAQERKLSILLCYSRCLKVCPRPSGSAPFCLPHHTSCERGTLASHHH